MMSAEGIEPSKSHVRVSNLSLSRLATIPFTLRPLNYIHSHGKYPDSKLCNITMGKGNISL
jgi:hypothetical protein